MKSVEAMWKAHVGTYLISCVEELVGWCQSARSRRVESQVPDVSPAV
jgi:hypothetical protein